MDDAPAPAREGPDLSVVLPADDWSQARVLARHVADQEDADRIELVLVVPPAAGVTPDPDIADRLFAVVTVESAHHRVLHRARAAGVRAARAPFVALAETHAFPGPGWARSLLARLREGATVVGPVMTTANPRSAVAWSNFLLDYGPWAEPATSIRDDVGVPGHNSAFARDTLVAYGERLDDLFRHDWLLIADLRRSGAVPVLDAGARTAHLNVNRLGPWLVERLVSGRAFAACRSEGWGPWRRALFALGSPAIPLLRLRQVRYDMRRTRNAQPSPLRVAAALAIGLLVSAAGEALGYAFGSSARAEASIYEMELARVRYVRA